MKLIEERKRMQGQGGFTLIELLVVIAILAVLGGAAVIGIGSIRENANKQVCKTDKETIETAAEAYKISEAAGAYPADVAALVTTKYLKKAPKGTWTISATNGAAVVSGAPYSPAEVTACNT